MNLKISTILGIKMLYLDYEIHNNLKQFKVLTYIAESVFADDHVEDMFYCPTNFYAKFETKEKVFSDLRPWTLIELGCFLIRRREKYS